MCGQGSGPFCGIGGSLCLCVCVCVCVCVCAHVHTCVNACTCGQQCRLTLLQGKLFS